MRRRKETIAIYCLAIIPLVFFVFPVAYFVLTSFRPARDVWSIAAHNLTLENYVRVLVTGFRDQSPYEIFFHPLSNSLIISGSATVVTVFVSLLAGYSIGRFHYRGRENIAFFILTLYMAPPIIFLVPLWNIAQTLNMLDNHLYLIACYGYSGIPLAVWLLRSFIVSLPVEIEESAMVDGCSRLGAFLRVVFPIMKPGLAVTVILTFIFNWNEYMFASTFTSVNAQTLTVAIAKYGFWLMLDWGAMSAMGILTVLPVFVLALVVQKYIISGLTLGAVKA